ncbi:unnamed protein product [Ceutorhynchus assimilis]|uniref:Uncharacterized protein n=1 Tax=Ceutorhynchus assimilis TaxID=467358 RepID=A0A9N9QQD4_9CUCU|nr:unnamed protein product [Ceutorhynchus assimilis]
MYLKLESLLFQISSLVDHGSGGSLRPNAVARVGQSVNLAVERFVTVGETIADDYQETRQGMYEACKEARQAEAEEMEKRSNIKIAELQKFIEELQGKLLEGKHIEQQLQVDLAGQDRAACQPTIDKGYDDQNQQPGNA